MKPKKKAPTKRIVLTDRLVEKALALAAQDAVEAHRRAGVPLAVWRDGKVALISADEVVLKRAARKPNRQPPKKRGG